MAVFVDPPAWPAHGRLWSHLVSDVSLSELHEFAAAHGVPRRGFERDHYDVPAELYDALVAAGAVPVSGREVVRLLHVSGLRKRKATSMARRSPGRELLRPDRLHEGDLVSVVAPAGEVWESRLQPGLDVLESWGLRVQVAPHVFDTQPELDYLAGSDADRAADFAAAWADPEVSAVMMTRGGYGTQLMVDLLDWRRLAEAQPTLLVGFSDVTALHQAVASRLGLVSVHGHAVTSLGAASDESVDGLRRLLFEPETVVDVLGGPPTAQAEVAPAARHRGGVNADAAPRARTLVGGRAEGVLVGGNLMVLASEVGSPFIRPATGGIAVLEDVNEDPYRLDRAITQLVRSGWFDGVRAIVCGAFTNCGDPDQVDAVLRARLTPLGAPAVTGVDLGHTPTTICVPLGVLATLDADAGTLTLSSPPFA